MKRGWHSARSASLCFSSIGAVRCIARCSALRCLLQHAASGFAARCVLCQSLLLLSFLLHPAKFLQRLPDPVSLLQNGAVLVARSWLML